MSPIAIGYAKALAAVGEYEQAWYQIQGIPNADFTVGEDVSSEHWTGIYGRRVQHISQDNIKDFARAESEDGCAELQRSASDE